MRKTKNKNSIIVGIILVIGVVFLYTKNLNNSDNNFNKLSIPPILEYIQNNGTKDFKISVGEGEYEFVQGARSNTYGYNGSILGPTIRFSKGDNVNINVKNNLSEKTTTHWHGGVVPGSADGGVHNIIPPGEGWDANFDVIQEAATLWYHPHQHEETARQVYMGLGGFIIIDDENSKSLPIPQEYGVDDIPIIIQSKNIDQNGNLIRYQASHMTQMHGFEGNTILINAQIKPFVDVSSNIVRFRILNGSNSDVYNLSLSNGKEFSVIASDGGFYNQPISVDSLEVPTAKRFEILIDLEEYKGESIWINIDEERHLEIKVANNLNNKYKIPTTLNNLVSPESKSQIDRNFNLEILFGEGPPVYGINGKLFDMDRVDFEVKNDNMEYWKVKNIAGGPGLYHPFHIHATQFYIVEFNGKEPTALQEGRHDTVFLRQGDEVVIAVPFDKSLEGTYMYHCHILEHEDAGMMGQFELIN